MLDTAMPTQIYAVPSHVCSPHCQCNASRCWTLPSRLHSSLCRCASSLSRCVARPIRSLLCRYEAQLCRCGTGPFRSKADLSNADAIRCLPEAPLLRHDADRSVPLPSPLVDHPNESPLCRRRPSQSRHNGASCFAKAAQVQSSAFRHNSLAALITSMPSHNCAIPEQCNSDPRLSGATPWHCLTLMSPRFTLQSPRISADRSAKAILTHSVPLLSVSYHRIPVASH